MVRKKKITVKTDNSNWQAPKKRKPRKPMSEEQRVAAAARLEKVREKRKEKNPDYGLSGIAQSLKELSEDHPRHPKKVKKWININKEERDSLRKQLRIKYDKKINNRYNILDVYVRNMQSYLKSGVWTDLFYGVEQEYKIRYVSN